MAECSKHGYGPSWTHHESAPCHPPNDFCEVCKAVRVLSGIHEPLSEIGPEFKDFDDWWSKEGHYLDPDTTDVSWYDKRSELARMAWEASAKARLTTRAQENWEKLKALLDSNPEIPSFYYASPHGSARFFRAKMDELEGK